MYRVVAIVACLGVLSTLSSAGSVYYSGELGVDYRYYMDPPQFPHQVDSSRPEGVVQPEFEWSEGGRSFYKMKAFLRAGSEEEYRNHADLRELYWAYMGRQIDATLGVAKVFWGVTESRHLVDIVNQTDLSEGLDEEEKLGQPMVNVSWTGGIGTLSAYWMPYFREREYPGLDGRLRTQPPVADDDVLFGSGRHNQHKDFVFRFSTTFDSLDAAAYVFHGYTRQPWLLPEEGGRELIPLYDVVTQVAAEIQYTKGAWLWKFEGATNTNDIENYSAFVGGFEYTLFQISESSADLGLLMEYLFSDQNLYAAAVYDDDVFVGARLALNDIQDSTLLAGVIVDLGDGETAYKIEGETRIGQSWTLGLNSWIFANQGESLWYFAQDDYVEFVLRFHY